MFGLEMKQKEFILGLLFYVANQSVMRQL